MYVLLKTIVLTFVSMFHHLIALQTLENISLSFFCNIIHPMFKNNGLNQMIPQYHFLINANR